MANQITDNRTLVVNANSVTPFDGLAGAASGTLDTEIFYFGTGSIGYYTTSTRAGLLYDAGSAQNWSSNTFYFLVNCGIVGLLATKASGGLTIRFCGNTVTDWFEVNVAGSDEWPTSFAGGWTSFVVDIETAAASPSLTNGTAPATSAIRYVGISTVTGGTMPRMVDNTWIDAIHRLPDGSAGIIVEGSSGGATPWTWSDVVSTATSGSWATARPGPGGSVILSTPVQFGIADTTTHEFEDTNVTLLWDNQEFVPDDVYKLSALGGASGTTNVTAGIKSGTGDTATGSQGWNIQAAATGARWSADFDDANLDSIGFYGCNFSHGDDFQLDDAAVETISTFFVDCSSATVGPDLFQRNSIIDANTADNTPFLSSSNPANIKYCNFQFSDGHAIQITSSSGSPYTFSGNTFTGYGADTTTDAAILVSALTLTLNVAGGGSTPTVREESGASVTVNNNVSVTFAGLKDNTEVRIYTAGTTTELDGIENATAGTTDNRSFTSALPASGSVDIRFGNNLWIFPDRNSILGFSWPTTDTTIPITQVLDRNYDNP